MTSIYLVPAVIITAVCTGCSAGAQSPRAADVPRIVPAVDISRYTGVWYEIAKIPNRFQRKCACNTTATYSLLGNGRINVVNRCVTASGDTIVARGMAKIADTGSNAKLKVSFVRLFGISLFWADYWIIDLADDYSYAVVGTPSRKYGWILCREPHMADSTYRTVSNRLHARGYDPADFERTEQK